MSDMSQSSGGGVGDEEVSKNSLQIKIDKDDESGKYSNAVSVNVNTNEVILDMGFILPNVKPTTIKVVSRISMNHRTAESFMKILQDAMLDWRNKQKGKQEH